MVVAEVHTLENVVPASTTVRQPPRKDPQMEYSKIVPQSEQTYRFLECVVEEKGRIHEDFKLKRRNN
ncbi:hypothetical protein Tco_0200850 [Tanacetum coccineum]